MHIINLEDLILEWKKDSKIDKLNLDQDLITVSSLVAKYAEQFVAHSIQLNKVKRALSAKTHIKSEYYAGRLNDPEQLKKYKLDPFPYKLNKLDIQRFLDGDTELNLLREELDKEEGAFKLAEIIVNDLKFNRASTIRAYIEYGKYKMGIGI